MEIVQTLIHREIAACSHAGWSSTLSLEVPCASKASTPRLTSGSELANSASRSSPDFSSAAWYNCSIFCQCSGFVRAPSRSGLMLSRDHLFCSTRRTSARVSSSYAGKVRMLPPFAASCCHVGLSLGNTLTRHPSLWDSSAAMLFIDLPTQIDNPKGEVKLVAATVLYRRNLYTPKLQGL